MAESRFSLNRKELYDAHVHMGQFYNDYYSPVNIIALCKELGISAIAVSSTTTCEENIEKIIREFCDILLQNVVVVVPVLWITPNMLINGQIEKLLNCGIEWKCVKIHNYQQRGRWGNSLSLLMQRVVNVAMHLHVPLLIHTGDDYCMPESYRELIERYKNQTFILAHSRPVDQTISLMNDYENVWADTAFCPVSDIKRMVSHKLSDRILFGTDLPMHYRYYQDSDVKEVYMKNVEEISSIVSSSEWQNISRNNFCRLFL